jgi:hypothetical protein
VTAAKRAPSEPIGTRLKELRIPIKKKTAENIWRMNQAVAQAVAQVKEAQRELENHILPLLTERCLEGATVKEVTEKEPYQLVVLVPK